MTMSRAELQEMISRELARPSSDSQGREFLGRPPSRLLTLPGTVVKLKAGESKTIAVEANDPLINEFGVYVSVEPESFAVLAVAPALWGVRMTVMPSFDSANFVYWRPSNTYRNKLVPVVGMALPVHGQRVGIQLKRDNDPLAVGEMILMAAIMPRLPGVGTDVSNGQVENALAFQDVMPAMARSVRVATNVSAGDVITFKDPAETVIYSTLMVADYLLKPIPIPKLAYKFEYFTVDLAPKNILVEYETFM